MPGSTKEARMRLNFRKIAHPAGELLKKREKQGTIQRKIKTREDE
jgi:hypothetical protein